MLRFFGAVGRFFTACWYLLTGRVDAARQALNRNPNVVAATFDAVVKNKTDDLKSYQQVVSGLIVQEEDKKTKLKKVSEELQKLESMKQGALNKTKELVSKKYSGDLNAAKNDPEYNKHQAAFRDLSNTAEEKKKQADELEADIKRLGQSLSSHKVRMESLLRELDHIKEEKQETLAEIISETEEAKIYNTLNGINTSKTSQELEEMRKMRHQVRAETRVSRELSGLSTEKQEQEYLSYSSNTKTDEEFEKLLSPNNNNANN